MSEPTPTGSAAPRSWTYLAVLAVVTLGVIVQIVGPIVVTAVASSSRGANGERHERELLTRVFVAPLAAPARPLPGFLDRRVPRSIGYAAAAVQLVLLVRRILRMSRSRTRTAPMPWNRRWQALFLFLLGSWASIVLALGLPFAVRVLGALFNYDGADFVTAFAAILSLFAADSYLGFPCMQMFGPAFLGFELAAIRREGFGLAGTYPGAQRFEGPPPRAEGAPHLLEGVRLRLRRSTPEDASATFRLAADPDVMRYLDWPAHRTEADARAFLRGCAERWRTGAEYHWMIEEIASGTPVGCIGVRLEDGVADFGYFLGRTFWGRGYASEACGLLLAWLRGRPRVRRIQATTDFENERSARLLEKLGLRLESVRPAATVRPNLGGPPRDTFVFVLADLA